jgi:hypothetical protein
VHYGGRYCKPGRARYPVRRLVLDAGPQMGQLARRAQEPGCRPVRPTQLLACRREPPSNARPAIVGPVTERPGSSLAGHAHTRERPGLLPVNPVRSPARPISRSSTTPDAFVGRRVAGMSQDPGQLTGRVLRFPFEKYPTRSGGTTSGAAQPHEGRSRAAR